MNTQQQKKHILPSNRTSLFFSSCFLEQKEEMVKFSKQFEGQLIPEWKDAFVDYWKLKKDIKRIHVLNNTSNNHQISSVVKSPFSSLRKCFSFGLQQRKHEPIQVIFYFYFEDIRLWILMCIYFPHDCQELRCQDFSDTFVCLFFVLKIIFSNSQY